MVLVRGAEQGRLVPVSVPTVIVGRVGLRELEPRLGARVTSLFLSVLGYRSAWALEVYYWCHMLITRVT
jgi:hypothetical protein